MIILFLLRKNLVKINYKIALLFPLFIYSQKLNRSNYEYFKTHIHFREPIFIFTKNVLHFLPILEVLHRLLIYCFVFIHNQFVINSLKKIHHLHKIQVLIL